MRRLLHLFHTSIGIKLMTALSGSILVLFLFAHMLGNLTVFQGPGALNAYAAWLQGHPLLWVFRLGMLGIFGFHILLGIHLTWQNRAARPQGYRLKQAVRSRYAERHMFLSGALVLAFLVYHIAHLTLGWVDAGHAALLDEQGRTNVYAKVVLGFQNPWIAGSYLLALGLLGMHLSHAIQSIFQTLGFNHESYQALIVNGSIALGALIVLGLASVPLSVQLGLLTLPAGASP